MNEENTSPPRVNPNPQSDNQGTSVTPPSRSSGEKVIQPSETLVQELQAEKQNVATQPTPTITNTYQSLVNTTYPEPVKSIDQSNLNTSQQFALASSEMRIKDSNRPVSLRVKSLLVVAVLSALAAAYGLFESLAVSDTSSFGTVIAIVSLIQLGMSVYLFIGKDHNTVALILKIYLALQLISLFFSLANPTGFVTNGVVVLFLFYVYTRVKSLSYY